MMNRKVAAYCGTRNLYNDMVNAAKSLVLHSDIDKIYFLIEDDAINTKDPLPDVIECVNVSNQTFFKTGPNTTTRFTYMAMMRAALALQFPEEDYILSLDVDTIVTQNINDLWDINLTDDYYFAACIEPDRCTYGLTYTNHGVVLYNLKKLRDGKAEDVIKGLNTHYYPFVDQDAMNYYCHGHILELDPIYNSNSFVKKHVRERAKIIHFAGVKKWNHYAEVVHYAEMPWSKVFELKGVR